MHEVIAGEVIEGDHRGRALGFPTANIGEADANADVEDGVYAGYATRGDGSTYVAAISVGRRPTYYDERGPLVVEAHLLDFDDDLYGERLVVEVVHRIRGQLRFNSESELITQMNEDVAATRSLVRLSEQRG